MRGPYVSLDFVEDGKCQVASLASSADLRYGPSFEGDCGSDLSFLDFLGRIGQTGKSIVIIYLIIGT